MKAVAAKSSSLENAAKSQGKTAQNLTQPAAPVSVSGTPGGIPLLQRKSLCPCDGGCPRCTNRGVIQPKLTIDRSPPVTSSLHHRIQSMKGGGKPLWADTRAFFEPRFGRDFSRVRVHNHAEGAEAARALNAKAFTTGNDVVFGAGRYSPDTSEGKHLLAHELTHVIQQNNYKMKKGPVDNETSHSGEDILQCDLCGSPTVPVPPDCINSTEISTPVPTTMDLSERLIDCGVLQSRGTSINYANILYRHVRDGTPIGNQYLEYLKTYVYPLHGFCIEYQRNGWLRAFASILDLYSIRRNRLRHQNMISLYNTVHSFDLAHFHIYDVNRMFPGGVRDTSVRPLTRSTIQPVPRGRLLGGYAPEGLMLLLKTDEYLTSTALSAAEVSRFTPPPVRGGTDIFTWGSANAEGAVADPNRYDRIIVFWVNYYNNFYRPLDISGNPNPLNPDLVKAMIHHESRFGLDVIGRSAAHGGRTTAALIGPTAARECLTYACGLTQITPGGREALGNIPAGITGITPEMLIRTPEIQIAAGIRWLFEKYRLSRNWRLAIRDYNGSPNREAYMRAVWATYTSHRRPPPP